MHNVTVTKGTITTSPFILHTLSVIHTAPVTVWNNERRKLLLVSSPIWRHR